jgi:ABC-type multidrug transport system fused ATPase/permease subunit
MARTSLRVVVAAVAFVFLAGLASSALAQAYKYKDDRGNIHFTENLHEIPARYRSQVETREMPVHTPEPGSAEAAAAAPEEGSVAASFQQAIQEERGQSLTPTQQTALNAWMSRWWLPALITVVLNFAVSLGLVIHAFNTGHIGWGLANFFLGFTTPIYLFVHVEQGLALRFGLLAIMLSPLVVIGLAVSQLATALA